MKTIIINIYGAPGSGKSTLAAELYVDLKKKGKSVELVRECIKKWAYQGYKPTAYDQIYITNEQMREEASLYGKVEYIITDSPIALGTFYTRYYHKTGEAFDGLQEQVHAIGWYNDQVDKVINLFLPIKDELYSTEGRYSSLEESKHIEKQLLMYLPDWDKLEGPVETRLEQALERI